MALKIISYIYQDPDNTSVFWQGFTQQFDDTIITVADKIAEQYDLRTTGFSAFNGVQLSESMFFDESLIISDVGSGTTNTIYSADDTIGAGRVATLTDTLTFNGGATILTTTNAGSVLHAVVGVSPLTFSTFGDLSYLDTGGDFDGFAGLSDNGTDPQYQVQIYDNTTFVESAGIFNGVGDFSGTDRPYYSGYYTLNAVDYSGFQADINGEQLYTQRLGVVVTALTASDRILFTNPTGYIKATTYADLVARLGVSTYFKAEVTINSTTPVITPASASNQAVPSLTYTITQARNYVFYAMVTGDLDSPDAKPFQIMLAKNGTVISDSITGDFMKKNEEQSVSLTFPIDGLVVTDVIAVYINNDNIDVEITLGRILIQSWS